MKPACKKEKPVKELTERQKVILEIISENPFIAAKAVAEKVSCQDRCYRSYRDERHHPSEADGHLVSQG